MPATVPYLVGFCYHEPGALEMSQRGLMEDFESSTGVFVHAASAEEALAWGERVAEALFRHVNRDASLDWKGSGYFAWIERTPQTSAWKHCLGFFPRVPVGTMPDLDRMGGDAYQEWMNRHAQEGLNERLKR